MFAQCADNSTNGWDALILFGVFGLFIVFIVAAWWR